MAKIVTLFFATDYVADELVALLGEEYYHFTETVSNRRMNRIMDYRRYQTAKRPWWDIT